MSQDYQQSGPRVASIAWLAVISIGRFLRLAWNRQLLRRRDRLGQLYRVEDGHAYAIFRETVSNATRADEPTVLVVGFRLRALHANRMPHWIFQRLCILTTPFWSGFAGFRVKLWMVEPQTKDYLGIYDWSGAKKAQTYASALTRVLRPVSTPGSVWFKLYPRQDFESFLSKREVADP